MKKLSLALTVIVGFTLVSCESKKKDPPVPRGFSNPPPVGSPPASPSPSPESAPATTDSAKPVSTPSYSQFMLNQQKQWMLNGRGYRPAFPSGGSSFSNFWCADGTNCQPYVVMVHIGNFGTCTGVLVAPKVVLTNRHCVEKVVNEPYAPLRSSIVITVPGSAPGKFDGKFSFVTALMAISPVEFSIGGLKPDYAFLSLLEEMEGFKGAKMNFNGIIAGETYHIFGVSPYGDAKDKSAVERRECKAVYNTTFAPFLDAPRDPMLMFAHCLIGPSNSGSPIYNDKDELVGIIGGQLAPPTVDVLNSLASTFFKITDETTVLGHIGWGTNLACMPDINDLGKSIHADCNRDFVQLPKPAVFPEKVRNQAETELKNLPLTDETFHYAVERANELDQIVKLVSQAVFLRVPDCIHPSALGNAKSPLDLDMSFSGAKLSPHWELTSEAAGLRSEKFTLTYDVEALKSKGTAELTVGLGKNIRFHKTQLKVCDGK